MLGVALPVLVLLLFCLQVASGFVHPGALLGVAELTQMKARVASGQQPWKECYNQISQLATGQSHASTWTSGNDPNPTKVDSKACLANALMWQLTGNTTYADQAINILNAWTILQGFNGGTDQDKLQAGWVGALFGAAADLMLAYPGWKASDIENVRQMFKRAYYPQLTIMSTWNGNVDLTQIDALINIAVFNEDATAFQLAIDRFRNRTLAYFYLTRQGEVPHIAGDGGNIPSFWSNPTKWVDGLTQETCRDNGHHTQYAMASALHACEVAYHQGVDLYGDVAVNNTARFTATLELLSTQLLTLNMQGTCQNNQATNDLFDTFEVGYNHYHVRMGFALPQTQKLILSKLRPKIEAHEYQSDWNIFYETLTHGGVI